VVEFAIGIPQMMKGEYTEGAGPGIDLYSMRQPLGVVAGYLGGRATPADDTTSGAPRPVRVVDAGIRKALDTLEGRGDAIRTPRGPQLTDPLLEHWLADRGAY